VTLIDADPNKPLSQWAKRPGKLGNLTVIADVTEDSIIDTIEAAALKTPFVIVDLEGTASMIVGYAMSRADLVIIPVQGSHLDATEAAKAIKLVRAQSGYSSALVDLLYALIAWMNREGQGDAMATRLAADEIIKGLSTTADKICALAQADYDRTEISQALGIRYQHVRNVLLRSGITGGLRRQVEVEREPVTVDAAPPPREDTSWEVLTQAGFQFLGEWTGNPDGTILLHAPAPSAPGVYAFVVDDVVVYVGLTLSGLRIRFDQYRRGHEGQRTSARINDRIAQTLLKGKRVKVLVATPEPLEWQELPVNTAAGLEAGLIEMIRPSWNIKGAR
jgi:hypothetical protein